METRYIEVETPHGFLIWQGKQTSIGGIEPFPDNESLLLVSNNEAFGHITLGIASKMNKKEFDRRAYSGKGDSSQHCVHTKERIKMWPESDTFYIQDIKTFERIIEIEEEDTYHKEVSMPVKKTEEGYVFIDISEEEQAVIDKLDKLPKHISLGKNAVFLRKDSIKSVDGFEVDRINKSLLADIPEGKQIALYEYGLIKNPRLLFADYEEEVMPHDESTSIAAGKTPPEQKSSHPIDDEDEKIRGSFHSLTDQLENVFEAFHVQFIHEAQVQMQMFILDVFEDHIIIRKDDKLFMINYTSNEGIVEFDEMENWVEVEQQFVAKEKQSFVSKIVGLYNSVKETFNKEKQEESPFEFSGSIAIKEVNGVPWYFTKSTNSFIDRDEEIFSNKSLQDFVDRVEDREDKGTFDFWHIPESDFARKEWLGVIGKFLVEAGPFLDNQLGKDALAFFTEFPDGHPVHSPEGWGCSPQFKYLPEDREDGVYDYMHILKTSTLPVTAAANIYTHGGIIVLKKNQREAAASIFGQDWVDQIEGKLEKESDDLDEAGIASKETEVIEKETKVVEEEKVEDKGEEITVDAILKAMSEKLQIDMEPYALALSKVAISIEELKSDLSIVKEKQEVKDSVELPKKLYSFVRSIDAKETIVKEEDELEVPKPSVKKPHLDGSGASNFFPTK